MSLVWIDPWGDFIVINVDWAVWNSTLTMECSSGYEYLGPL